MPPPRWMIPALLGATLAAAGCASRSDGVDSLLLVTIDTLRADHVSCYGKSRVSTPNLDRIARTGARIERAWTTIPLTTPAHASILTGLYPPGHGVRNNARFRLPDDVLTLAEILGERGRKTAAFVGSFTTSRQFGLAQGFDTFDDDMGNEPDGRRRSERRGDEVVARALPWLERNASKPFFLWVHLFDPHAPYDPPPEFARRHAGSAYGGEVAFADFQVGRILDALRESGAESRTLVAVLGDHGEGLDTHGEAEHGFLLYEESLWVPFLLAAAGKIEAGSVVRVPASIVDFVPTALSLLGVAPPAECQGRNLLAMSPPSEPRRGIYAETLYPYEEFGWSALYAFRLGDLKVIEAPRRELYDLAADPGERRDVAPSRVDDTRRLAEQLREAAERLVDAKRLATAAGLGAQAEADSETIARLESLGYVGGSGGAAPAEQAGGLPAVGGRNPRDAMDDYKRFDRAQELLGRGEYAAAVSSFESLRRNDPDNPQVGLKLAQALQRADRDGEAEAAYADLVRRHPTFYLGYRSYSDFLERANRARESRDLWLKLLKVMPGYVGIEVRLAQAETSAGLPRDAVRRLEPYVERRADDALAWNQLGRARAALGDSGRAIEAYRKALDLRPTEAGAAQGLTRLLASSGRKEEALRLIEELIARAPEDPFLKRIRAELIR